MNAPLLPPESLVRRRWLLDANSNGLLMSREEFESLTEEDCEPGPRYELLNGVVIVSPPPSDGEIDSNDELGYLLRTYQQTPAGKCLDKTLFEREVATSVGIRRVDRALWIGFGRPINSKIDLPTIIVEFVSAGKRAWLRDYQQKRGEYLQLGTKEYWIIDRFRRTLTACYPPPADPAERVITEFENYQTPLLPGFEVPLKRLLALSDLYRDEES